MERPRFATSQEREILASSADSWHSVQASSEGGDCACTANALTNNMEKNVATVPIPTISIENPLTRLKE
jgi:hypothetical protein